MRANLAAFVGKNKVPILLILLLFVGSCILVVFYVSVEKAFYVWDNEFYYRFTGELYQQFNVSFGSGIAYLIDSLNNDYNVYYALPIQPFFFIAGNSRPVYEIALVAVYLVPFILVTGLIGRRLLQDKPGWVFWLFIGAALLVPTVWLPTLRAYPDTAAALAAALATLVYLKDPSLKRLGRLLLLGLLIGLATLLRRHFAYTALSFFGAAGVVALVRFAGEMRDQGKARKAVRRLIERILQLALAAIFALLTVTAFNPQVVVKTLVIDFNKLYSSYLVPWTQELGWFLDSFGWLPFGLAVSGLVLLWRNSGRKEEVLFFGLFGLFELLFWGVYVRQISIQYTLHLSIFIVVGLAAFLLYGWEAVKTRAKPALNRAAAGLGVVFLVVNCLAGVALPPGTAGANLFSTNWQPLIRDDYAQVINLTNYLDQQTTLENPIYVAASSYRFNSDTFLAANRAITGQTKPTINLLVTPDIDSRDFYPLDALQKASIVVVIDPFEYHIASEQQQVVKVVFDMFLQKRALAQDFAVLNDNFLIDARTKAKIYKRVNAPSRQTALETLQMIQAYVKPRPGGQFDWINLDPQKPLEMSPTLNRGTELEIDRSKWATPTGEDPGKAALIYAWPLTGQEKYQGKVTFGKNDCSEATVDFSAIQGDTTPARFAEFKAKPGQGQDFEVIFSKVSAGQFVLLEITTPVQPGCTVKVDLEPVK